LWWQPKSNTMVKHMRMCDRRYELDSSDHIELH